MGRGRGKGKKQSIIATRGDDAGSGEDEKLPPSRRRGRPQKPMKDEIEEEDKIERIEDEVEEDGANATGLVLSKNTKNRAAVENSRKRKRHLLIKESLESAAEEKGVAKKNDVPVVIKSVGYRQNGSRRKNKPTRAAEAGFEFK